MCSGQWHLCYMWNRVYSTLSAPAMGSVSYPMSLLVRLKVICFFIVAGYFLAGWVTWADLLWGHEIASFGGKNQQGCKTIREKSWGSQDCTFLWPMIFGHLKPFMKLYPQSVHTWIHLLCLQLITLKLRKNIKSLDDTKYWIY